MLYLVGLGLGDAKDITARGLEIVKRASRVYLEAYTSILTVGKEELVTMFFSNDDADVVVAYRSRFTGESWCWRTEKWWNRTLTLSLTELRRPTLLF